MFYIFLLFCPYLSLLQQSNYLHSPSPPSFKSFLLLLLISTLFFFSPLTYDNYHVSASVIFRKCFFFFSLNVKVTEQTYKIPLTSIEFISYPYFEFVNEIVPMNNFFFLLFLKLFRHFFFTHLYHFNIGI